MSRKKEKDLKKNDNYIVGEFTGNSKGFGFVTVEGMDEDLFIPEEYTHGAFHMDTVEVEILPETSGKRREGRIRNILVRGITEIVGTYEASKNYGFVVADNAKIDKDIFIQGHFSKGAVTGDKVVVEITDYGNAVKGTKPEGKVKEIIGNINDPGVDIISIVKAYELPESFPERVMNQAEKTPDTVSEADMAGRTDLRDVLMVTIDGEDSKDLDDAVSLTKEGNTYHLGVHIADVANYVQENSALDREAYKRGTSVYLVDRVIPMLPHKLSNGICSLNHGEDRLSMSCLMTIDNNGAVIDHKIVESVINVNERMTYTSVAKILDDKDPEEMEKYDYLVPMFQDMAELASILRNKRKERGSIDFDFPESKIILDKDGNPLDIKAYERNTATDLIEDFMLIANETVAEHFYWMQAPFLYRIHEKPDTDKISNLSAFIKGFGYNLRMKKDEIHPKEIQKLLAKIEGKGEESVITRLALRSMMQAKYSTECLGHFGLACDYYTHFTSPIRRYPDLQIHRIIKDYLRGRMTEDKIAHYREILDEVATHTSQTERRADEAERETDKLKKAQYMEDKLGEVYEGIISGVTAWGMFVELPNTCEGLIRAASLEDDFYIYDENSYSLIGERSGNTYTLGQKVTVRVVGADRLSKTIDFKLAVYGNDTEEEYNDNNSRHKDSAKSNNGKRSSSKQDRLRKYLDEDEEFSKKHSGSKSDKSDTKSKFSDDEDDDEFMYIDDGLPDEDRLDLINRGILKITDYEPDAYGRFRLKLRKPDSYKKKKGMNKGFGKKSKGSVKGRRPDLDNKKSKRSGSAKRDKKSDKVENSKKERKTVGEKLTGDGKNKSGRKVYKVHKYKKSATSKAARSSQGKKRKK
ncbi:MAG: ribonuclease R [Butyrivibrio sp.]|nr:ribonuclease R [Butyrivibrio sp.]